MNKKLTTNQNVLLASMLFGMFFGAGNLIFPIILGAQSGANIVPAIIGMLITAVGIPLLGVIAMGVSRSEGLMDMSSRVSRGYAYFFTCALYLTIGPLFAIPRCAATSFSTGIAPLVEPIASEQTIKILGAELDLTSFFFQLGFTALFFGAVLFFSLRPNKIMTTIGKWLNPIFLTLLAILVIRAMISPVSVISEVSATGTYQTSAFTTGFLQGYDTLDALASLAFGIIVINAVRSYGVQEPNAIAKSTAKSGAFSMALMALVYVLVAVVGAQAYGLYADKIADGTLNGGTAFALVAKHYFGTFGLVLLALIVTFCCLKTAIGLVTSCSETFAKIFPRSLSYKAYTVVFTAFSFLVSNIGLNQIIKFSIPVLYFLYPLAIVLILLALFGKFFAHDRVVYVSTIAFTMIAALCDLIRVGQGFVSGLSPVATWIAKWLPLYNEGLGWLVPALFGALVGLGIHFFKKK